jgi:hypothetical protein
MKRLRKQPRRMTPPLLLRDQDGERTIVALDEELVTDQPQRSNRATLFLNSGAWAARQGRLALREQAARHRTHDQPGVSAGFRSGASLAVVLQAVYQLTR